MLYPRLLLGACLLWVVSCKIRLPHFPIYGINHKVTWDELTTNDDVKYYPEGDVPCFSDYQFFVNDFNFEDASDNNFFVGFRDQLVEMSLTDLTVNKSFSWSASDDNVMSCETAAPEEKGLACFNHIRLYKKLPFQEDRLFVCGTDAYSPKCRTLAIANIGDTSEASTPASAQSLGVISLHPSLSFYGDFASSSHYLTSGYIDSTDWDTYNLANYSISYDDSTKNLNFDTPAIMKANPNSDFQIADSYFPVKMLKVSVSQDDMFLLFFRERDYGLSEDYIPSPIRSRVVRICVDDDGTDSGFFHTFIKADIVCSKYPLGSAASVGSHVYHYTFLRDLYNTPEHSRWYENDKIWVPFVYGVFTGDQYGPNGSAICAYHTNASLSLDINSNEFKYRGVLNIFDVNVYLNINGADEQLSLLDCGVANANEQHDHFLTMQPVQPFRGLTIPILEMEGEVFTTIVADQICVKRNTGDNTCSQQDVMFVGTDNGKIYKLVYGSRSLVDDDVAVFDITHTAIIAQEWELSDSNRIEKLYVREVGGNKYLLASTYSRIYKLPIADCSRHGTCSECIGSRDPYCFWDSTSSMCVSNTISLTGPGTADVSEDLYQNVTTGMDSVCNAVPNCTLEVTPCAYDKFKVVGDCSNTDSLDVSITPVSTGCSGTTVTTSIDITDGIDDEIQSDDIVGLRLYEIVVTATDTDNKLMSKYTFYQSTPDGPPRPPDISEIFDNGINSTHVQVKVVLDGCTIPSATSNLDICVQFSGLNLMCQSYSPITTFMAGSFESCQNVSYSVMIKNSLGNVTTEAFVVATLAGPPPKPQGLQVSDVRSTSLSLSWNPPDLTNYHCSIIGYSVSKDGEKRSDCMSSSSFFLDGLYPNTQYELEVAACSESGEGMASELTAETACAPPPRVEQPMVDITPTSLSFLWDDPDPIAYNGDYGTLGAYWVAEQCYDKLLASVVTGFTEVPGNEYIISSLAPNTRCCIAISTVASCKGSNRNSTAATEVCAVTGSAPPGPVENLRTAATSPHSILAKWDPPMNYTAPDVRYNATIFSYIDTDELADEPLVEDIVVDQLFYHFTNLEQNTKYYISIMPFTEAFEGMPSDVDNHTLPDAPRPPTDVMLEMNGECQLIVSWTDDLSDEYGVQFYEVVASCNNNFFNASTADTSVEIDVCPMSGNAWCTARVQAYNLVGPGDFSIWGQAVFPLTAPTTPLCFLTEDLGSMVVISYTISAPYSLDNLYLTYSLTSDSGIGDVDVPSEQFNGTNTLTFRELSRNTQYTFRLRLCDKNPALENEQCSEYCTKTFYPSQFPPAPPASISVAFTAFDTIAVTFDPPPNEDTTLLEYDILLYGANSTIVTTSDSSYSFSNLLPGQTYSLSIRSQDHTVNLTGHYSSAITFYTPSGEPGPLGYLGGVLDTRGLEVILTIYWFPPSMTNGTIESYTLVWHPNADEIVEDCLVLYNDAQDGTGTDMYMETIDDPDMREKTYTGPEAVGLSKDTRSLTLCMRANTEGGNGSWTQFIFTENFVLVEAVTDSAQSSSIPIAIATTIAVIAIVAAVVIAFVLGCAIYHRRSPIEATDNGGLENINHTHSPHHQEERRGKRVDRMESTRSTAPMINQTRSDSLT